MLRARKRAGQSSQLFRIDPAIAVSLRVHEPQQYLGQGVVGAVARRARQHEGGRRERVDVVERRRERGETVMFVAIDGKPAGVLAVSDPIRPSAKEAVAIPLVLFRSNEAGATPTPRYIWNDKWTSNLLTEAFEGIVPEISIYRAPK